MTDAFAPLTVTVPVLHSERLVIRPPRAEDLSAFAGFFGSERSRFVGGPNRPFEDAARSFGHAAGLWLLRGYGLMIWCDRESGKPIGHGGPWFPMAWPEPEFGWSLWDGAHEGKGYAREAMEVLIPWAWEHLGLETALAYVDTGNTASRRLAERLGGVPDPEAEPPIGDDGEDLVIYRFHPTRQPSTEAVQ